ncbi:hypothetical protein [Rugamonas sp.]|nr:hypothetical protein [Rugamonas sp.]
MFTPATRIARSTVNARATAPASAAAVRALPRLPLSLPTGCLA